MHLWYILPFYRGFVKKNSKIYNEKCQNIVCCNNLFSCEAGKVICNNTTKKPVVIILK